MQSLHTKSGLPNDLRQGLLLAVSETLPAAGTGAQKFEAFLESAVSL
jgi:hypothetical protein